MARGIVQLAVAFGIGGSLLAIAVPAFVRSLNASKLSEPIDGLTRMVSGAIAYGGRQPTADIAFPPSVELTPAEVPRGVRVVDPPGTWEHLTWRSLRFGMTDAHAFAYKFETTYDPATELAHFVATAHGDLDGDGNLSLFAVQGERRGGSEPRALPGLFVRREVE